MKHDVDLKALTESEQVMRVFPARPIGVSQTRSRWLMPAAVGGVSLWGTVLAFVFDVL